MYYAIVYFTMAIWSLGPREVLQLVLDDASDAVDRAPDKHLAMFAGPGLLLGVVLADDPGDLLQELRRIGLHAEQVLRRMSWR